MERTFDGGGWKQRERDGFGRFLTRKRSVPFELLMSSNVSLSPAEILGSGCQGGVEKEKMESWRCWCAVVVHRERERERER